MGSVYAGLLAAAGNEVWAIDQWREHIDAIASEGLRVEGASGDRTVAVSATTDAADAGTCELVIIATKAMDVERAASAARPLVGEDTVVLSIQNGLGGPDAAASVLGDDVVTVGVVGGFGASIVAPGHARHEGWELVRLGERSGPATHRVERVAEIWREAGFRVETYDDVGRLVWEKLVCNVAYSGPCTILERTIGEVLSSESGRDLSTSCAAEAYEIGCANGISFTFDDPERYVLEFGSKIPDARPSMLLDYMASRRGEIDVINGAIPRVADSLGRVAPINATVSALVRTKEHQMLVASAGS
jgi:2-dehydropantoate 2-reductase